MIEITFGGSDKRMVASQVARANRIVTALALKLNSLMIRLQAKIVGEKLEGQVLHHRSGKLIESIRVIPAEVKGEQLIGGVQGAGGPAWYGSLHEFGYTYQRQASKRRIGFNAKGEVTKLLTRAKNVRRSVATTEEVEVRSYTVHIPERSFMRSSQAEMQEQITDELKQAADDAAKE
jgi:hypothetical protein